MAFRCFFITKPFEIDELLARIIVQLRKQPDSHRIFSIIRVYYDVGGKRYFAPN